jgi:hypothetical protein
VFSQQIVAVEKHVELSDITVSNAIDVYPLPTYVQNLLEGRKCVTLMITKLVFVKLFYLIAG